MPPNRYESEATSIDNDFESQRYRHHQSSQEALREIIANTHPTEVIGEYDDYWTAVVSLQERVVHAESWQRLGSVVLRGRSQESPMANDLTVEVSYDQKDPLEQRISEVSGEMGAILMCPRPEDATQLKLLELDHVLLTAQRAENLDRSAIVTVALSGIEQVEQEMQVKYQTLMEQPGFVDLFGAEFAGLGGEVSADQVIAAEKCAFDALVARTYEVAELQELHELAVSMQEEIRVRGLVLDIARQIVPGATLAAQERIAENIPLPASLVLAA